MAKRLPVPEPRSCERMKRSRESNSARTLLAREPKDSPRGVGLTPLLVRMKRGSPISPSSSDIALETACTETPSHAAAEEKLPVDRIAVTYLSCFMFTNGPSKPVCKIL